MSNTYTNDPANVPIDAVRFLIGDVNSGDWQLTDQEITFAIAELGPKYGAAYVCATALAGKYSREATATAGKLSVTASDKAKAYATLASRMWTLYTIKAKPKFGGVLVVDKQRANSDAATLQPSFKREQFDNPEATQEDNQATVIGRLP
jgi:hypothetical protein